MSLPKWKEIEDKAWYHLRKKLPQEEGWTIVNQCDWFDPSDRPDYVAIRTMKTKKLEVRLVEVKCKHKTPLTKGEIDQLCGYAKHLSHQVEWYELWMICCDRTEIPPEVREYGNNSSDCFHWIRLFH